MSLKRPKPPIKGGSVPEEGERSMFSEISNDSKHRFLHIHFQNHNNVIKISIINPLNAELNPICHLLALLGAHHILHVSRIRVKKCMVHTVMEVNNVGGGLGVHFHQFTWQEVKAVPVHAVNA